MNRAKISVLSCCFLLHVFAYFCLLCAPKMHQENPPEVLHFSHYRLSHCVPLRPGARRGKFGYLLHGRRAILQAIWLTSCRLTPSFFATSLWLYPWDNIFLISPDFVNFSVRLDSNHDSAARSQEKMMVEFSVFGGGSSRHSPIRSMASFQEFVFSIGPEIFL